MGSLKYKKQKQKSKIKTTPKLKNKNPAERDKPYTDLLLIGLKVRRQFTSSTQGP
jgi:hypothetical protein